MDEIKKVENGVKILLSMIEQFQDVIMGQSEVINSIESNVVRIRDHVERGVKHVESAKEMMMDSQDKMCCIFFIFVVVMVFSMNWLLNMLIY